MSYSATDGAYPPHPKPGPKPRNNNCNWDFIASKLSGTNCIYELKNCHVKSFLTIVKPASICSDVDSNFAALETVYEISQYHIWGGVQRNREISNSGNPLTATITNFLIGPNLPNKWSCRSPYDNITWPVLHNPRDRAICSFRHLKDWPILPRLQSPPVLEDG